MRETGRERERNFDYLGAVGQWEATVMVVAVVEVAIQIVVDG